MSRATPPQAPAPPPDDPVLKKAADKVFVTLAELISREGDEKTSGMVYRRGGHVNYGKMFAKLDMDSSGQMDRDELRRRAREDLKIKKREISDDDLNILFDAIDLDKSNCVSIQEFARFSRSRAPNTEPKLARSVVMHCADIKFPRPLF